MGVLQKVTTTIVRMTKIKKKIVRELDITLEMALMNCFEERGIKVEEIAVKDGASLYIIKVKR